MCYLPYTMEITIIWIEIEDAVAVKNSVFPRSLDTTPFRKILYPKPMANSIQITSFPRKFTTSVKLFNFARTNAVNPMSH